MRCLTTLILCLPTAWGQLIEVGVKAGVPVTENFQAGSGGYTHAFFLSSSKTRRYTVGISGTVRLPLRLGVEVDGLYRRINYDWFNETFVSAGDGGVIYSWSATAGNRFDVPLLLRWSPVGRFYAVGGPIFGIHSGFRQRIHTIQDLVLAGHSDSTATYSEPGEMASRLSTGVTFGVGFDAVMGRLHLKPEVRYAHWISSAFDRYVFLLPETNDVELLVGFEFGGR